jgi:extradiol dioxygenase family protein
METKGRIESKKIEYHEKIVKDLKQTQLFLMDPAGNRVELNFAEEV